MFKGVYQPVITGMVVVFVHPQEDTVFFWGLP